jgi:Na+-transporting methylmalonyl-CoA/oxaloacetate decarboxylase gamma subunit
MKNKITLLILAITLVSCSTRKVAKSEVKETTEVKAIDTTKTVTNTQKFERSVDTSTVNEFEIVPIDITKPMVVNGKTYLNAILKRKVTKLNKVVEINEKTSQIEQKGVSKEVKQVIQTEVKQTERKNTKLWWLWFLLLIPIYFIYRKYLR